MKQRHICQTCQIMRSFLAVAGLLIGLIWLRPDGIVALAGRLPATEAIVAAMMSVGLAGFGLRYLSYRRARRDGGM